MKLVSINGRPLPELESCPISGELTADPNVDVDVIEMLEELLGDARSGRCQAVAITCVTEYGQGLESLFAGNSEHNWALTAGTVRLQQLLTGMVESD